MSTPAHSLQARSSAIDALRGLVMFIMLADHAREFFFLHRQVGDPMDVAVTAPSVFIARILAHLCPAVFVFLSGLSAYLYAQRHAASRTALCRHLLLRGALLVLLEVTLVNFAWTFRFPPHMIYLQVIWAIGLSMVALAGLVWLPPAALVATGLILVAGHNALTPIQFAEGSPLHIPWAILHDRSVLALGDSLSVRTSYPVLPWIGVIALGYAAGGAFSRLAGKPDEVRTYCKVAIGLLLGFALLRYSNLYGESQPWQVHDSGAQTIMSFFNITKYPPSLLYLMLTLGCGFGLFGLLRHAEISRHYTPRLLADCGKAPLFFYVLHLYLLHALYRLALFVLGANQGERFGFDSVAANWLLALALIIPLQYACRWYAAYKKSHPNSLLQFI